MPERKLYRSNQEYKCDKCGQPIKPQTDYYYQKFQHHGTTFLKRYHAECPKVNNDQSGQDFTNYTHNSSCYINRREDMDGAITNLGGMSWILRMIPGAGQSRAKLVIQPCSVAMWLLRGLKFRFFDCCNAASVTFPALNFIVS